MRAEGFQLDLKLFHALWYLLHVLQYAETDGTWHSLYFSLHSGSLP